MKRKTGRARHRSAVGIAALVTAATVVGVAALGAGGAAVAASPGVVTDPSVYVDPIVGTTNAGNTTPAATAPYGMLSWGPDMSLYDGPTSGANAGHGTLRTVSPSGYEYNTTKTRGFSLTHVSGAGCAGLAGDVPFLPIVGGVSTSPSAANTGNNGPYVASYSHQDEHASAGEYQSTLSSGIGVDLSATTRAGAGTFSYPAGSPETLLVRTSDSLVGSSAATVNIDPSTRTISGSVTSGNFCGPFTGDGILQHSYYTVYFTAHFDTAFQAHGTWTDGTVTADSTSASGGTGYTGGLDANGNAAPGYPVAGKGSGAYVTFDQSAGHSVGVRVGMSYVSAAGAQANLDAEVPAGTTTTQLAAATKASWKNALNAISIGGGTEDQRTAFYTALYHAMIEPNIASDEDGHYVGPDGKTHTLSTGQHAQYANFSGWDVYRSQSQLTTLLDPQRGSDFAQSLLNQANQNGGVWDRWTHESGNVHVMNGDPSAAALSGILAFGGSGFNVQQAYDSLKTAATVPTAEDGKRDGFNVSVAGERPSLDQFLKLGYYPDNCNAWGCPNETLEIGAADYGLSTIANYLGDTAGQQLFEQRSQAWGNQFNQNATANGGYFTGRAADGTWDTGFDPASDNGFVEGSAAQYVWMVQHDVAGLADAMGGNAQAAARLDAFFHDSNGSLVLQGGGSSTHAALDNEPSIATPWLYNYFGQPWKTQQTVRDTIDQLWVTTADGIPGGPDGIPGNDDLGEMSSWLVFASMGIYPQNPSRAELTVAAPLFPSVTIHRASGQTISITAPNASEQNAYVHGMTVDGTASDHTYLDASAITKNTTVNFDLASTPDTTWGTQTQDAPPSDRAHEVAFQPGISPATIPVTPGGTTTGVQVSAQRVLSSATQPVNFSVTAPSGITPNTLSGTLAAGSGSAPATAQLTFRADQALAKGSYPVTVHLSTAAGPIGDETVTVVVGDETDTVLSTGFEPGQAQAPSSAVVDSTGWNGYCCGLTGAESKVQSIADGVMAHSGSNAVVWSGHATANNGSATNTLVDLTGANGAPKPLAAVPGATLTYWVQPQEATTAIKGLTQNLSANVAVDLLFTDGTRLSNTNVTTSNGATLDPVAQAGVLKADQWNQVQVTLPSSVAGKTIKQVLLHWAAGPHDDLSGSNGYLRGWVDDVSLVNPVPALTVNTSSLSTTLGTAVSGQVATFSGGLGTTAADYRATVDWGDGSTPVAATVTAGANGSYTVTAAAHTYASAGAKTGTVTVTDSNTPPASNSEPFTVSVAPVFNPSLTVPNTTVQAGGSLAFTGTGFAPGETVTLSVHSDPVVIGSVEATASGTVSGNVTIPAAIPAGAHELLAVGATSGAAPAVAISVTAAPVSGPGAGSGTGTGTGAGAGAGSAGAGSNGSGAGQPATSASTTAAAAQTALGRALAFTGSNALPIGLLAFVLLGSGAALVVWRRRLGQR